MSTPLSTEFAAEEAIFLAALECVEEPERARFLDEACAGQPERRQRVVALLAAVAQCPEDFLPENPAGAATAASRPGDEPGCRLGPYILREKLGGGGFGAVWRAEQTAPLRREVALKVIREGHAGADVAARFESERQVLALMEHPNIAAVLEAGTTDDGRPYFAMEWVRGVNLADYCRDRSPGLRERLGLFLQICGAVQHAHQKGLLHRDLKPANVLVTEIDGRPVAKVIDFGIAKALAAEAAPRQQWLQGQTQGLLILGTPQYMSPEQAGSAPDIDTRSDIYSLGVLLYELLTGHTPLSPETMGQAAVDEVLRLVREHEPARPSTRVARHPPATSATPAARAITRSDLSGDLDWIVLKALEKDRDRRFASVGALADDVRAHLQDEPVAARPPSLAYRVRKLARKHRAAFAAAAAVALAVLAALAVSVLALMRERHALAAEAVARRRAEKVLEFFTIMLREQVNLVGQGKNPDVLRLALDHSAERLSGLHDDPEATDRVSALMTALYRNLGEPSHSLPLARLRAAEARAHFGPTDPRTLQALVDYGRVLVAGEKYEEGLEQLEEAVRGYERTGRAGGETHFYALKDRLRALVGTGRVRGAALDAALEELHHALEALPPQPGDRLAFMHFQAELLFKTGRFDQAAPLLRLITDGGAPQEPSHLLKVQSLMRLAECAQALGDKAEAMRRVRQAIKLDASVRGPDYHYLADRHLRLASLLTEAGQGPEALASLREALRVARVASRAERLRSLLTTAISLAEKCDDPEAAKEWRAEASALDATESGKTAPR